MFNAENIVFIVYLLFMLGIGLYFFIRSKDGGDKVVVKKAEDVTVTIPEDYKWNSENILVKKDYVAQIGDKKYETLAETRFAAHA